MSDSDYHDSSNKIINFMIEPTKKQSDSTEEPSTIPILICPNCSKSIPLLQLDFINADKGEVNINLSCSCYEGNRTICLRQFIDEISRTESKPFPCSEHDKKVKLYCIDCITWLCLLCFNCHKQFTTKHVVIEKELIVQCIQHRQPFEFYCKTCKANICPECSLEHQYHQLTRLKLIPIVEPQMKSIQAVMERNRRSTTELIERIDQEIQKLLLIKEDITAVFSINEAINKNLKRLYESICSTSMICDSYPLYELMRLNQAIILNTKPFELDQLRIEDEYKKLKVHLQNNFILKLNTPSYDCTTSVTVNSTPLCLSALKNGCLAIGLVDNTIQIWDLTAKVVKATLKGHCNSFFSFYDYSPGVRALIVLSDGQLASASSDKTIKLWSTVSYNCTATLKGLSYKATCLTELTGSRLASGLSDNTIWLWSTVTNECEGILKEHNGIVLCLAQLTDSRLASGSEDTTIRLWMASKRIWDILIGHSASVMSLIELSDFRLASASSDKTIKLWNPKSNECEFTLIGHSDRVLSLIELTDGRIASGGNDNTITLWSTATKKSIATIIGHISNVSCLAEINDGRLASCSSSLDNTIKLWDVGLV